MQLREPLRARHSFIEKKEQKRWSGLTHSATGRTLEEEGGRTRKIYQLKKK